MKNRIFLIFASSVLLTLAAYTLFALFTDTRRERRIRRETAMYEQAYPGLWARHEVLEGAITSLQIKDDSLFRSIFKAPAPQADPVSSLDFLFGSDSIPNYRMVRYTRDKAIDLLERSAAVDSLFSHILMTAASPSFTPPPLSTPLKNLSSSQVGASVGKRVSPVYSSEVMHNGIDLIAFRGEPVYAAGGGVVSAVVKLKTGLGKYVEISHPGGYTTRYAHLDEVFVSRGQKVRTGQRIGLLGMSGAAFAPHLHYEVVRDGVLLDPVHYFFMDVSPWDYANMLFMTANTGQSLD